MACLENPMDRGAWQAIVHRVAKSQTQLNDWAQARVGNYGLWTKSDLPIFVWHQLNSSYIKKKKNGSIVGLQCCVNFYCTAKWFSYVCVSLYVHILFHILFHYGLSQDNEYSSLCYTVGSELFMRPIYTSLHPLIPSILPQPLPHGHHFVLWVWICFFS